MYPIYNLDYKICLKCGKNTVYPCDSRGYQSSDLMIYSVTHMKCKNCGEEYYIKWIPKEEGSEEMIPVCVDASQIDQTVEGIINYSKSLKEDIINES